MTNQEGREQQEQDEYTFTLWTDKQEKDHSRYREWLKQMNKETKERLRRK